MSRRFLVTHTLLIVFGLLAFRSAACAADGDDGIDFLRQIRPLLSNNCFQCHGPDSEARKGGVSGLRLDTFEGATADQGGHAAIVPGKVDASELIKRLESTDPDEVMPPPKTGKKLSAAEKKLLADWIRQGAKYSKHWSYAPTVRSNPPTVSNPAWPRNDIDRFILARLDKAGLKPSPEADRYALIRRASLDITGLPPTLDEVDAFVKDPDSKAYEKLVDRLLNKESYGEHWAHQWLDLARYADSAGYADDPPRTIWLFRDYVIKSFNANKPFDQFTIEQIAGDLLPNPTEEQLVATAFHRNTLTNNEGGTNDEEFRNVAIVDRVNTTMAVWMGTTMTCAQCHNHKYDPILQEDYFKFFAVFNNTDDADRRDESPLLSVFTDEQKKQRSTWEAELAAARTQLQTPTPELKAALAKWDSEFPRDLAWNALKPTAVKTQSGKAATTGDDATVRVAAGAATDSYTLDLPLAAGKLRALRLEALADPMAAGQGPGHAGGNFIVSRVLAAITPPAGKSPAGRFIRIEIPGKQKILSLAEVQVFDGSTNVALAGEAKQSSTDFGGPPNLAIDGKTDGRYNEGKSVTHTAISDDPWWEVDLKSIRNVDRVVLWNRTDPQTEDRLANFKLSLLDEQRQVVWQQSVAAAPKPSGEYSLSGRRGVEFNLAVADYSQPEHAAELVLSNKDDKQKGWAVGGQTGRSHYLTLITKSPIDVADGSTLTVTIEHAAKPANHTLAAFRLSASADERAAELGRTPLAVLDILKLPADQRSAAQQEQLLAHYQSIAPALDAVRKKIETLTKQLADSPAVTVPIMRELPATNRRVTKIQNRGNFLDLGKEVTAAVPTAFHPVTSNEPVNRLTVAKWLVDENNPLTARVLANRYWEQLFGQGIVSTSEEFGSQGELPTHPELLDWLATELHRTKWDLKGFVRMIVTSATYRQSSKVTDELLARDPDNRLLARGPRFRLSAETVRDQALAVSGLLSPKMYGPPVKPPQPSSGLSAAFGSGIDWQTSGGDDKFRRGLYTTWRRSNPYPSMVTFDAPNREVCTLRRVRTNTPLQALVTLNDPVYIEAAQALARRMIAQGGTSPAERAQYGVRLALTRPATDLELQRLVRLFEQTREKLAKSPDEAKKLATDPLGPAPAGVDVVDLAAWTVVGNVLLNLDETIMKR